VLAGEGEAGVVVGGVDAAVGVLVALAGIFGVGFEVEWGVLTGDWGALFSILLAALLGVLADAFGALMGTLLALAAGLGVLLASLVTVGGEWGGCGGVLAEEVGVLARTDSFFAFVACVVFALATLGLGAAPTALAGWAGWAGEAGTLFSCGFEAGLGELGAILAGELGTAVAVLADALAALVVALTGDLGTGLAV
jgi:hypothetical protein